MTNEEKAREIMGCNYGYDCLDCGGNVEGCNTYKKVLKMAKWKDEQFKEMIQSLPKSVKDLIETLSR